MEKPEHRVGMSRCGDHPVDYGPAAEPGIAPQCPARDRVGAHGLPTACTKCTQHEAHAAIGGEPPHDTPQAASARFSSTERTTAAMARGTKAPRAITPLRQRLQ